jgi:hypothetical protein
VNSSSISWNSRALREREWPEHRQELAAILWIEPEIAVWQDHGHPVMDLRGRLFGVGRDKRADRDASPKPIGSATSSLGM